MKKQDKGNYIFVVPNDDEGAKFLELCKKYAANGVRFRQRGLQADRKGIAERDGESHGCLRRSVSLAQSDRIRLYACTYSRKGANIFGPKNVEYEEELRDETQKAQGERNKVRAQLLRARQALG